MIFSQLIIFIVAFGILAWASKILISSLTRIAKFLQISEYILSFIIMGLATSVPELFLAISSGAGGISELSFGNIIGANILNITLLVGLIAVVAGGIKSGPETKNGSPAIFIIAITPFILVHDGLIDRLDGILLMFVYFWYLSNLIRTSRYLEHESHYKLAGEVKHEDINQEVRRRIKDGLLLYEHIDFKVVRQVFVFLAAVALLLLASFLIIDAARGVAESLNLGLVAFGIVIVSIGTTMPELVFGVRSVLLKHDEMTVGNALGSLAVNSTLVLGLAALISPVNISFNPQILFSIFFLIAGMALFKWFVHGEEIALTKKEGTILVFSYIAFVLISALIS